MYEIKKLINECKPQKYESVSYLKKYLPFNVTSMLNIYY